MQTILFAVLAGLCWGIGEMFTKSVLHTKQIGPITAIAVRSTFVLTGATTRAAQSCLDTSPIEVQTVISIY